MRLQYSISELCRYLGRSTSGYYAWQSRPPSKRSLEEGRLELEILAAHKRNRETFGSERLQKDLVAHGIHAGVSRIRRIRNKLNIRCKQNKKFRVITTDSKHGLPVADNLLKQEFKVSAPCKVWLSDITYIPTSEGWLYLAGHKDLFTGEIVGYAMASTMTKNLIMQSLFMAVSSKRPEPGLTHHSDRGSQYCSWEYRNFLDQFKMQASMSRRGNCYDNAPMESFWGTIKNELIHHRKYFTRQEAIKEITEYIEIFYNRQRIQARLGYMSPARFEQQYYKMKLAA